MSVFSCVWPGVKGEVGCESVLKMTEGDEKSLKGVLLGKPGPQGVVWWEPRIEGRPGRIYQIQVGDTVHLEYEKTARLYAEKKIIQDDPEGVHDRNWMATYMLMLPIIGLVFAFFWFLPDLQKRAKRADGD